MTTPAGNVAEIIEDTIVSGTDEELRDLYAVVIEASGPMFDALSVRAYLHRHDPVRLVVTPGTPEHK